jgi:hypothetical protein
LLTHQKIGWKRHLFRQIIRGKKPYFTGIGTGFKFSADIRAPEPYPYCLFFQIMKIRMNCENRLDVNIESGFFFKLTLGRYPNIFIVLDVSARDTPHPLIRSDSLRQEQFIIF